MAWHLELGGLNHLTGLVQHEPQASLMGHLAQLHALRGDIEAILRFDKARFTSHIVIQGAKMAFF